MRFIILLFIGITSCQLVNAQRNCSTTDYVKDQLAKDTSLSIAINAAEQQVNNEILRQRLKQKPLN